MSAGRKHSHNSVLGLKYTHTHTHTHTHTRCIWTYVWSWDWVVRLREPAAVQLVNGVHRYLINVILYCIRVCVCVCIYVCVCFIRCWQRTHELKRGKHMNIHLKICSRASIPEKDTSRLLFWLLLDVLPNSDATITAVFFYFYFFTFLIFFSLLIGPIMSTGES